MNIILNNHLSEIKKIVELNAKYQKVMILYDNFISNNEIQNIYNEIKNLCIFNKMEITNIDENELNNGYRVLIFLCSATSFLNFKYNMDDFINVFYPSSHQILPFFISDNKVKKTNNFLLLNNARADLNILSSISINQFINYFQSIISLENINKDLNLFNKEITQLNLVKKLDTLDNSLNFYDIEILKCCNLDYSYIPFIDLLLINAFIVFINSVKNEQLSLVDVYKTARDNSSLIEKFFSMANNDFMITLINLNYNQLNNLATKTKENILESFANLNLDTKIINNIVLKVKGYLKYCNNVLGYLYLYNIFSF